MENEHEDVQDENQAHEPEMNEEVQGTGILQQEEEEGEGVSFESLFGEEKTNEEKAREGTPVSFQKRLDKLTAERNEAIEALRSAELKNLAAERPTPPIESECEDRDEYLEKQAEYEDKRDAYFRAKAKLEGEGDSSGTTEADKEKTTEENNARYISQAAELQEQFPNVNIRELVDNTDFGQAAYAIASSENSAKIAYYYASNPKELQRLQNLDVVAASAEVGRFEERIKNPKGTRKTTKAPGALNTLKGGGQAVNNSPKSIYEIKDSNEFFKAWKKEVHGTPS